MPLNDLNSTKKRIAPSEFREILAYLRQSSYFRIMCYANGTMIRLIRIVYEGIRLIRHVEDVCRRRLKTMQPLTDSNVCKTKP